MLGYHTCYQHNGSSAVDYGLVSPDLYSEVPVFTVLTPDLSISDHSPIVLYLKVNSFVNLAGSSDELLPKPGKLNWDKQIKERFSNLINSDDCKNICNSFLDVGIKSDQPTIDAAVKFLSDVIVSTAKQADLSLKHVRDLGPPVPPRGGRGQL